MSAVLFGALLVPRAANAQPTSFAECLPQPTLPLPTCVAAETSEEHAQVTLMRARAWLRAQQFAPAAEHLAPSLHSLRESSDIGLQVRIHSELGEALLGLGRSADAELELRAAAQLWASEPALSWLRSLPAGEVGGRALRGAVDAASRAVLRIAELHWQNEALPPPRFAERDSLQPFAPRRDSELSQRERAVREAWGKRQRAAFIHFVQTQVPPWVERRRTALQIAERELQQVYLMPPVVTPEWRIAVAADIGRWWMDFAEQQETVAETCGSACDEFRALRYSTFDNSWEQDKQRARSALEVGVALSRRYRLVTEHTLVCEQRLAKAFRSEYRRLDELVPAAHWGAP